MTSRKNPKVRLAISFPIFSSRSKSNRVTFKSTFHHDAAQSKNLTSGDMRIFGFAKRVRESVIGVKSSPGEHETIQASVLAKVAPLTGFPGNDALVDVLIQP